jgi:hypothetical protein
LQSVYDPEIVVEHTIPAERLTKRWFRQRAWWQGISQGRMSQMNGTPSTGRRLLSILQKSGWGLLRLGRALVSSSPAKRFRRELQVYEAAGEISALWQMRSNRSELLAKVDTSQELL